MEIGHLEAEPRSSIPWNKGRLAGAKPPLQHGPSERDFRSLIEHGTLRGLEDNMLVFYNQEGQPSTRFTEMAREEGKIVLRGRLLLTDEVVFHVMRQH